MNLRSLITSSSPSSRRRSSAIRHGIAGEYACVGRAEHIPVGAGIPCSRPCSAREGFKPPTGRKPAGLMTAHHSEQHKALSSGPIIAKVIVEDLLLDWRADPGRSGNIPCLPGEPGRTTCQSVSYGLVLITCH
jgi:hypothetical protein